MPAAIFKSCATCAHRLLGSMQEPCVSCRPSPEFSRWKSMFPEGTVFRCYTWDNVTDEYCRVDDHVVGGAILFEDPSFAAVHRAVCNEYGEAAHEWKLVGESWLPRSIITYVMEHINDHEHVSVYMLAPVP